MSKFKYNKSVASKSQLKKLIKQLSKEDIDFYLEYAMKNCIYR